MPIITISDKIKEGQEITTTDINNFITQINDIGFQSITTGLNRFNGENIRNEGIDRRNITRKQVQEVGDLSAEGTWLRTGPVSNLSPPIWFQTHAGMPNPVYLSQSFVPSQYVASGHPPFLQNIPVQEGDKVIVTCSFAFSVFPLDTTSNNLINSTTTKHGGYEVILKLQGWAGTTRKFNTYGVSNVQGGGYRHVATQNTCTIVGYWNVTTETKLAAVLTAKCQRTRSGSAKDCILRIKSFHMFAKIVRR